MEEFLRMPPSDFTNTHNPAMFPVLEDMPHEPLEIQFPPHGAKASHPFILPEMNEMAARIVAVSHFMGYWVGVPEKVLWEQISKDVVAWRHRQEDVRQNHDNIIKADHDFWKWVWSGVLTLGFYWLEHAKPVATITPLRQIKPSGIYAGGSKYVSSGMAELINLGYIRKKDMPEFGVIYYPTPKLVDFVIERQLEIIESAK